MSKPLNLPEGVTIYPPTKARNAWRIVYRHPHTGERKNKWRVHREDALEVGHELAAQIANAATEPDAPPRAGETLDTMLEAFASAGQAVGTRTTRRSLARALPRWLRNTSADSITLDAVRQALDELNTTPQRRHNLYTFLRTAYNYGVDHGYTHTNPLPKPRYAGGRRRRAKHQGQSDSYVDPDSIPSTEQVERLADAAEQRHGWEWGVAIRLSAYAGLRIGEICGLAADKIDLPSGTILVARQYQVDDDGRIPHLHAPKGGKRRTTILPVFLEDDVRQLLATLGGQPAPPHPCPKGCEEAVEVDARTVPLWPDTRPHRTGWNPQSRVYQRFLEWRIDAGWPTDSTGRFLWNWHALRHHFCTWALASADGPRIRGRIPSGLGLEVADVSHFAGHSSPAFTWQAYVSTRSGAVDRARRATA